MSGNIRRRQTTVDSDDVNKPSTSAFNPYRRQLKEVFAGIQVHWPGLKIFIFALFVVIAVFAIGALVGLTFIWKERLTCGLKIPKAKRPKTAFWSEEYTVGSVVQHRCKNESHSAVNRLFVCNWEFYWMMLLDLSCECPNEPMFLKKTTAVLEWNETNTYNSTAQVKCNSYHTSEVALYLVCTENRIWEIDSQTPCDCSDLGYFRNIIEDKSSSITKYQIGSSITERCSWTTDSPPFRTYFCNLNSQWLILEEFNHCECLVDASIDTQWLTKWSNNTPSKLIGTTVVSYCSDEPTSNIIEAHQCERDRKWKQLINPEDSYCDSHLKILPSKPFFISKTLCKEYNGQLITLNSWEDRYELATRLRYLHKDCAFDLFYIGVFEDLNYQWRVGSKPVKHEDLEPVWEVNNPDDVNDKCVVMNSAGKLENKNCKLHAGCFFCQKEKHPHEIKIFYDLRTESEARVNCSQLHMKLLTITSKYDVENLFASFRRETLICKDYITDLRSGERVWKDVTGKIVPMPHWKTGEPTSFRKNCVAVSKSGKFMQWQTTSCDEYACGICSQFQV